MQINKYHAVALHLTYMGTSRKSGVNTRHGFEQAVFSRKVVRHNYRSLSNKIYQRIAHSFIEVCPMKNNGGWFNILSESVQRTFKRTKTKTLCFINNFSYMVKCMCEGIDEDSRHRT